MRISVSEVMRTATVYCLSGMLLNFSEPTSSHLLDVRNFVLYVDNSLVKHGLTFAEL